MKPHQHHHHNPITKLILNQVFKNKRIGLDKTKDLSDYVIAKGYYNFKVLAKQKLRDIVFIIAGILCAAFGLESFLIPNHFVDGGATGISLLIAGETKIPLYIILTLINIPFMIMGSKIIGKAFAIKTSFAILGLSLAVANIHFPEVTHEKILVALFGGFFLGAGIGLSVRGGSVLDGTEVLAIYLSRKLGLKITDIIILLNIVIFMVATYFLGIDAALYSMITYLSASKTLDFVIEGIEEYTGVTIVSAYSEEIRRMIIDDMGKGVTVYVGKRGFGTNHIDVDIIYTIITRLELNKLNSELERIDPNAFVTMSSVKDTRGGVVKKRPLGDH
jgi:uncharacterized membrane-anchored protein YitT (DUF2179 family)